jgi:ABC-2 type transport system permease protein
MPMRGLWKLTWLETKIFVREPLGLLGSLMPVVLFVVFGRMFAGQMRGGSPNVPRAVAADLPIFMSLLLALNAVLSLVTIVAIYREGGILRRLRATPLRPHTILAAHVFVKLALTAVMLGLMLLAGRRYYPVASAVPLLSYAVALLFSTASILSLGFLIASVVPTARFAQPFATLVLYPMLTISGLFVRLSELPPALRALARVLPLTYAVSLLRGIWTGDAWSSHVADVAILTLISLALAVAASRVFRWE